MGINKIIFPALVISLIITIVSCKKDAGEGGNSSLYGKVYVKDYNSTFTVLEEEYYAPDEDVYIIYDNDRSYGDHTKTSYDGTYEFKYLRPGTYHIYAYSKDSSLQTNAAMPVTKDVKITKARQEVEVPEIVIFK
jgi:hypothetical protein